MNREFYKSEQKGGSNLSTGLVGFWRRRFQVLRIGIGGQAPGPNMVRMRPAEAILHDIAPNLWFFWPDRKKSELYALRRMRHNPGKRAEVRQP